MIYYDRKYVMKRIWLTWEKRNLEVSRESKIYLFILLIIILCTTRIGHLLGVRIL